MCFSLTKIAMDCMTNNRDVDRCAAANHRYKLDFKLLQPKSSLSRLFPRLMACWIDRSSLLRARLTFEEGKRTTPKGV